MYSNNVCEIASQCASIDSKVYYSLIECNWYHSIYLAMTSNFNIFREMIDVTIVYGYNRRLMVER